MMMSQSVKPSELELEFGVTLSELFAALKHGIYYYSLVERKLHHYQVHCITLNGVVAMRPGQYDFVVSYSGYGKLWWIRRDDIPKEILAK